MNIQFQNLSFILEPTLHSHTHCQVAPADPQAKTWQRVCLSHRTTNRQSGQKTEGQQLTAVQTH